MRLLNTETYERVNVEEDLGQRPDFAILSHRWEGAEVSYQTFSAAALRDNSYPPPASPLRASVSKIRGACQVARSHGLKYLWIDTCCIDKDRSEELQRALNSMFAWYSEAAICYAYLADVTISRVGIRMFQSDLKKRKKDDLSSEWFDRGWTLQELLAPRKMEFYDKHWNWMGSRNQLAGIVGAVSGIDAEYLQYDERRNCRVRELHDASIATRLSWMAGRVTRDVEDIAYSLLGILNINMNPQYGEGVKAFSRLQEILLTDSDSFDESLFAWTIPENGELRCYRKPAPPGSSPGTTELVPRFEQTTWGLLAPSPDCFKATGDLVAPRHMIVKRVGTGFQRTHQGVHLELPLKETKSRWTGMDRKKIKLPLNCWRSADPIVIEFSRDSRRMWLRSVGKTCESEKGAKVANNSVLGIDQGDGLLGSVTISQPQLHLTYPDPA